MGAVVQLIEGWAYLATESPVMQLVERVAAEIAATDIPVLLVGESGTGKEVLARKIHESSPRVAEEFFKVRGSELGGWLATQPDRNPGNGKSSPAVPCTGTLFLDEICELDSETQAGLLAALPDGAGSASKNGGGLLRARLIGSTARNTEEELRAGRFREELYFRLNGVCLRLLPLRHRKEDIAGLFEFFLEKHAAAFARPRPDVSELTRQLILEYSWPGNVRELENFARKIVVLGDDELAATDLAGGAKSNGNGAEGHASSGISLKEASRAASREAERELIMKTLTRTRWNRKRAAQELQISYKALLYKLKELDVAGTASPGK
jgi:two-component system response regulator AtoC